MKLHLKDMPILKTGATKTISVLAVVALTGLATLLVLFPRTAASAPVLTLQCEVGSTGVSIACSGTIPPDGSGTLSCQSPDPIDNNNGVYTLASATCSGTGSLAGVNVTGTLHANVLTIDSNHGSITTSDGGGTLSYNLGLSSATIACNGSSPSLTSSPLSLNLLGTTCNIDVSVLGILGIAEINIQGGSISATSSSPLVLSIPSSNATVSGSVLGLITHIPCGNAITVDLAQTVPITVPLALCSGS